MSGAERGGGRRGALTRFCAKACLLGLLLLGPWGLVERAYPPLLRGLAAMVLVPLSAGHELAVEPVADTARREDVRVVVARRGAAEAAEVHLRSDLTGWLPTGLYLALALATPRRLRRRRGLLDGLVAVQGYVALRLGLLYVLCLAGYAQRHAALYPGWVAALRLERAAEGAVAALHLEPSVYVLVPVLLWLLLCLRPEVLRGPLERALAVRGGAATEEGAR